MSDKRVSRTISKIGEKAGILVNADLDKYASAHDLRHSFGSRRAQRWFLFQQMALMRHESIEVTTHYYAEVDAVELALELRIKVTPEVASRENA